MAKVSSTNNGRGLWAWDIVKLVTILSILLFLAIFYTNGFHEESTRLVIRLTARFAVVYFCLAFGASAFHSWGKNSFSWWLFMNRKFWGISFAILHLIHLGFIFLLQICFHPVFEQAALTSLLGGGLAYVFLILMLLTSFPFFAKLISKTNWKRLHTFGGYWIWLIFMISYSKRVIHEFDYLPQTLLLVSVLLFRFRKIYKNKKN